MLAASNKLHFEVPNRRGGSADQISVMWLSYADVQDKTTAIKNVETPRSESITSVKSRFQRGFRHLLAQVQGVFQQRIKYLKVIYGLNTSSLEFLCKHSYFKHLCASIFVATAWWSSSPFTRWRAFSQFGVKGLDCPAQWALTSTPASSYRPSLLTSWMLFWLNGSEQVQHLKLKNWRQQKQNIDIAWSCKTKV